MHTRIYALRSNLEIKKDFTDTHNTEKTMVKAHRNETNKDL